MPRKRKKQRHKPYLAAPRSSVLERWELAPATSKRRAAIAATTEKLIHEIVAEAQKRLAKIERSLRGYG